MTRVRRYFRTTDGKWLLAIVGLALAVRLVIAVAVTPDPRDGRFDDTVWYDTSARHLASGDGYVFDPTVWKAPNGDRVYPSENELTPTALWPPGYPTMLAVVYALTGDSVAAGRLLNAVFGALTAGLVFLVARKLFERTAAVAAGIVLVVMPSHALFTSLLLAETYFGFLLAAALALCVYFVFTPRETHPAALVGLGALVAFAGYVRGEFLVFGGVLALLVVWHWRRRALGPVAALAAGAALIVIPWTVRNAIVMDDFLPGTTGSGRVMYQGHNPETDGGPSLIAVGRLEADIARDKPGIGRKDLEKRSNEEGARRAREWALDHKVQELELVGRRMWLLFRNDEAAVTWLQSNKPWFSAENADRLVNLSTFYFWAVAALAVAGARRWWSTDAGRLAVIAVIPFYMVMFGVLFIGDPRYHYAMYVPMAVLAGPAIAALLRLTAAQWREVFGDRTLGDILRTYGTREA